MGSPRQGLLLTFAGCTVAKQGLCDGILRENDSEASAPAVGRQNVKIARPEEHILCIPRQAVVFDVEEKVLKGTTVLEKPVDYFALIPA